MKWYNDMTEQQKQSFKKVIAVCAVGGDFNFVYSCNLEIHFISKI